MARAQRRVGMSSGLGQGSCTLAEVMSPCEMMTARSCRADLGKKMV